MYSQQLISLGLTNFYHPCHEKREQPFEIYCPNPYNCPMPSDHNARAKELSRLARIKLSPEEEASLEKNIEQILTYMDQIEEVDTQGVPPCTTVLPTLKNVLAEDEIGQTLDRETFLANAPDQVGGMIKVPPVMQEE